MLSVRVSKPGGLDALELVDLPEPKPGSGELTLEIKAAAINHLDLWVRKGLPVAKYPIIPGSDAAGIIRETGKRALLNPSVSCGSCEFCSSGEKPLCTQWQAFGEHRDGTNRGVLCVPAENLIPIPDSLSFEVAAAAPLVSLTAWRMLMTRGRLAPSEDVLIWSGGAGVGVACIQYAKLAGARVIATASTDEKCSRLKDLGADWVLNHVREDVPKRIRELTAKRGVDVVIDHVGQDTLDRSVRSLAKGGRLVTCGGTSGPKLETDLRPIFFKGLSLLGSTMGSLGELHTVLAHFERGTFKPVVDRVLPMERVGEAHRLLESRAVSGKIVLTNPD